MEPITEIKASLSEIMKKAGEVDGVKAALDDLTKHVQAVEAAAMRPQMTSGGTFVSADQREHADRFTKWLRNPRDAELRSQLRAFETKAASGLTDAAGGAMVPELLLSRIFDQAKAMTAMRRLASVESVTSGDVKFVVSANNAGSGWAAELGARNPTAEPTLIERKPTIGTCYALIAASEELVFDSAFNVAGWFSRAVADEIALQEGAAFISGNGTNKPTGILATAPVADLDASPAPDSKAIRYIPTGVAGAFPNDTLASPPGDPLAVLHSCVYSLRAQYRSNAVWLMNSNTAGALAKLRDGDGRNLWQQAPAAGQPPSLLGYRVEIDEAMPDVASNSHPILFGDFRRAYLIADAGGMRVTVDDNISTPGVVRFYVRRRVGGIVADQRAVIAIKAAVS